MVKETVYTASAALFRPREFAARARADAATGSKIGWQLFRTSLRVGHRGQLLGNLWLVLPATVTAMICVYLQSTRILSVSTTELPYGLHVLTGLMLWQTFVDGLNAPLQELEGSRHMLSRSAVPHEAFFMSGLLGIGLNSIVRLVLVVGAVRLAGWIGSTAPSVSRSARVPGRRCPPSFVTIASTAVSGG